MKKIISCLTLMALSTSLAMAQDPIVSTKYTADPAPYVHGDTIYLYTTHDEDDAEGFKMFDWLLYTSTDMVNWTDHGAVASLDDFKWYEGKNGAWAEEVIERNGKWYMYCPIHGHGIGVLVSDSPYGPFRDPIGHPLVWQREHWEDIDPTILIDDDGQAYMFWGNPHLYVALLNDDMISLKSDAMRMHGTPEHYQEGPWAWKKDGKYYLGFASTCCPEGLGYAMSENPLGPYTFRGYLMAPTDRTRGNHPGIIQYKGKWYGFGLNYDLKNITIKEHKERRSVGAFNITYRTDGTIQESPYFKDVKVEQIENFNPYRPRIEAETMAWGFGVKTVKRGIKDIYVTDVDNGEYILLRGVDFGTRKINRFSANCASTVGGKIELHTDSPEGKLIGTVKVSPTGNEETFRDFSGNISNPQGIHDLYLVFKGAPGKKLLNFDYWNIQTK